MVYINIRNMLSYYILDIRYYFYWDGCLLNDVIIIVN